jgi:methyl-accepting chemotaxis protein
MKTINESLKKYQIRRRIWLLLQKNLLQALRKISAAGQEQLTSTEVIAQSSKDLYILASELSTEINRIKI